MQVERNTDGVAVKVTMKKPFDGHAHLRQGPLLAFTVPLIDRRFEAGIVMPNLKPPVATKKMAMDYCHEIRNLVRIAGFHPLMTLYLTDSLSPAELEGMRENGIMGIKYYPRGLTTNSDSGVADTASLWTEGSNAFMVLKRLAEEGGILLLHAADGFDNKGRELDPYEQEPHFIRETLPRIIEAHPGLKISVEHLSSRDGAMFMFRNGGEQLGCSITLQHLTKDRRDVFRGGFRPHLMWWPVIQGPEHKEALQALAMADKPFTWLGTDSAPHPVASKESACCVGGVLTHHIGVEGYVEAFEDLQALDERLERFASQNGPDFFGIEPTEAEIVLERSEWTVSNYMSYGVESGSEEENLVPFRAGEKIRWKIAD